MSIAKLIFLLIIVPHSFIKCQRDLFSKMSEAFATKKIVHNYFQVLGGPHCTLDEFRDLVTSDKYFVDKSLLIKEIIHAQKFLLIVRPRKWGKSINLSMIRDFFALEVTSEGNPIPEPDKQNKILFCGGILQRPDKDAIKTSSLAISKQLEITRKYLGKHPVVTLDFHDIFRYYGQPMTYEHFVTSITSSINDMYEHHKYLKSLHPDIVKYYRNYLRSSPLVERDIEDSLQTLVTLLYEHFNATPVFVAVDEYFAPVTVALRRFGSQSETYVKIRSIMDAMLLSLSRCQIANTTVVKMIMTGTLDVMKLMDKSSRHNFHSYSSLNERFAEYYGFTDAEVDQLYKIRVSSGKPMKNSPSVMKSWYTGYVAGTRTLYNPFAIKKCLSNDAEIGPYWMVTAGSKMLDQFVNTADPDIQSDLTKLLFMDTLANVTIYPETENPSATPKHDFYSRLYYAGYLTCEAGSIRRRNTTTSCNLRIPNPEIRTELLRSYNEPTVVKLQNTGNATEYLKNMVEAARAVFFGNMAELTNATEILLDIHATVENVDQFNVLDYHRFMSRLLMHQYEFVVKSVANVSQRRYEHLMIPHQWLEIDKAMMLQYAVYEPQKNPYSSIKPATTDNVELRLSELAQEVANEAIDKKYLLEAQNLPSITKVHVIGIAFYGKLFRIWDKFVYRIDGFTTPRYGKLIVDHGQFVRGV